jgi:hypothetical protein
MVSFFGRFFLERSEVFMVGTFSVCACGQHFFFRTKRGPGIFFFRGVALARSALRGFFGLDGANAVRAAKQKRPQLRG